MATLVKQVDLPYTPRQMFDLVADIESYPSFLRHVESARIIRRIDNTLWVDQRIRIAILRAGFRTRAQLEPASRIAIECADHPLGTFTDVWTFRDGATGGTRLACRSDFEIRSILLRGPLTAVLGEVLSTTMRAFQARAKSLYGDGGKSDP
jgi:coenzyme Q-binding protein COQ10